jgi:hypothetical protein
MQTTNHSNEDITIHPKSAGTVEVHFKGRLRELWELWGSKRICCLLRGQIEPDREVLGFALGDHPAFEAWRMSFPPNVLKLAKDFPKNEITFLELANREPAAILRHARLRPGLLLKLFEGISSLDEHWIREIAGIARRPITKILRLIDCPDSRAAIRIVDKWPPELRTTGIINSFFLNTLNRRKLRVSSHYKGRWTRDVLLCLSIPPYVVSDELLHLAKTCDGDDSIYSAAREILSDFGTWPFTKLPKSYPRFLAAIERQYERKFRDESFPAPILPAPAWGSAVETPRELRQIAIRFQNCLFAHLDDIRSGTTSAYFSEPPGPHVVWLVHEEEPGDIQLGQVAGFNNERPGVPDLEAVRHWFDQGGVA